MTLSLLGEGGGSLVKCQLLNVEYQMYLTQLRTDLMTY